MKILLLLITMLFFGEINNAQNITISGYVNDIETGEPLLYAFCHDTIQKNHTITNSSGYYTLTLQKGKSIIQVSYLGYKKNIKNLELTKDTIINFQLTPITKDIDEVIVNGYTPIIEQVIMGKTMIPVKTIKAIPSFVGISDIMKAISYIPGISTGKEGNSNIYVRGGDRGQNLVLLDGMKLYNTNHLGGFFSLFNTEVIKRVDVYKGGFPARYGGRTSSIIDIYTKNGDAKKFKGKFNIGLLNSGIIIEGPIKKNISYFFAARTSYYDLLTMSARREYNETGIGSYTGYTFFDINSKINWRISEHNNLSLSIYTGHDFMKAVDAEDFTYQSQNDVTKINIHNSGISLMHDYVINNKMFLKNTLSFSNYKTQKESISNDLDYGSKISDETTSLSKINDITLNSNLDIKPNNKHTIKIGIESSAYIFTPSLSTAYYTSEETNTQLDTTTGIKSNLLSLESSIYVEDEINLTKNTKINFGLRGTMYNCKDTNYYRIEPRVSFRWLITKKIAFKFNYTILNQYNHVLINNINGLESELWLSATKNLAPQRAEQFSTGLFYGNKQKKLDLSIEAFHKNMSNLIAYRSPINDKENINNIDNIVAKNGKGESYGIECQAIKKFDKLSFSLNYTLSWSNRKFKELNNGAWYPFIYDRRHNLTFLGMCKISNRYSFTSNFVLSSGTMTTLPIGLSKGDKFFEEYYIFGKINNTRLPLYHRLDISIIRKGKTRKGNDTQFSINIFNVYARKNPVYIYYESYSGKVYQKSFFTIIPTLNFSINF